LRKDREEKEEEGREGRGREWSFCQRFLPLSFLGKAAIDMAEFPPHPSGAGGRGRGKKREKEKKKEPVKARVSWALV